MAMFEAVQKPLLGTMAERVSIDPSQGVLGNIATNVGRGINTMNTRQMWGDRAHQLNQALDAFNRQQAVNRQQLGLEKTAAGLWGRVGRGLRSGAGQTAIGGGLGYGKDLAERAYVQDPNMSPEMQSQLRMANIAGGAMLGNPAARRFLFTKTKNLGLSTPTVPPPADAGFFGRMKHRMTTPRSEATMTQTQARLGALAAVPTVYFGSPAIANYADATRRFARQAQKGLTSDKYINALSDPVGTAREAMANAAREGAETLGKSPAAHAGATTLANTVGSGLVGGLTGGAAGTLLGNLVAGDDPKLDYKARRRREGWRSALGLGGTIAGGLATPYLTSKYAPNLIPSMVNTVAGKPVLAPAGK